MLKEISQELIQPKEEKALPIKEESPKINIQKSASPLAKDIELPLSKYNIQQKLVEKEEEQGNLFEQQSDENLPNNHFTETDLQNEWIEFLKEINKNDIVVYNAINGFQLHKMDENTIRVIYPSETARAEFDKVNTTFFNHFKHKMNHYRITVEYKYDAVTMKKEIVTKRSLFDKFAEKNPLLRELDDIFKFDFNK